MSLGHADDCTQEFGSSVAVFLLQWADFGYADHHLSAYKNGEIDGALTLFVRIIESRRKSYAFLFSLVSL